MSILEFEKLCCRLLRCKQWYETATEIEKEQFKPQMYEIFTKIDADYSRTKDLELKKQKLKKIKSQIFLM